jgi:alpha-beta hydrolase superfamily lysophospholipase
MTNHIDHTREFFLTTNDHIDLFVRDWLPEMAASPAAVSHLTSPSEQHPGVIIMHGLGEHCGRYAHVARFFSQLGFAVRSYDLRGHGQSGGARGSVPDGDAMLRDARLVINDFTAQLHAPPILFGHSMGGLFAARFATEGLAPLRALILSSPALAVQLSSLELILLSVATALFPDVGISNGVRPRFLTHDAEVVEAYKNDRMVHTRISARLLNCMRAAMTYAYDHAPQLQIPVLMLVAEDDRLVDPMGSKRFAARLPVASSMAIFYEGFYHEVFNEVDAARVFEDVRIWLETQGLSPEASLQR